MSGSTISLCITPEGNWLQVLRELHIGSPRAALFLDRDGVVVEQVHHLRRPEDVRIIPGAAATIRAANDAGWPVVIVSNQSGIARGYFGWEDFAAVQHAMLDHLATAGATIDMVLACPFHPEHSWRKPKAGMLRAAAERLPIDLGNSWMIGDKADDLIAGRDAGLRQAAHVLTGYGPGERSAAVALATPEFVVHCWNSIADGAPVIRALTMP